MNVKNVQIDPQTTEIWPKQLNVALSVSDTLVREEAELLLIVFVYRKETLKIVCEILTITL